MMSTIEIQRTDDGVADKLRAGIREANREGDNQRSGQRSGITPEAGSQQPEDYSATVELGRNNQGMQQRLRQGPAGGNRGQRRPPGRPHGQVTSSGIDTDGNDPDVDMLSTIEIDRDDTGRPSRPQRPARQPRRPNPESSDSGIQVEHGSMAPAGMSGTVTLSRKGMGMQQRPRGDRAPAAMRGGRAAPPSANVQRRPPRQQQSPSPGPASGQSPQGPYSIVQNDQVACPNCAESYEVPPEVYGALAECPDCGFEFSILAPGSAPPQAAPAQQPPPPGPRAVPPAQPMDPSAMPKRQPAAAPTAPAAPASEPEAGTQAPADPPADSKQKNKRQKAAKEKADGPAAPDNKILIIALVVLSIIVVALLARMLLTG